MRPVPPPRDHLRIEQDGRLVNRAPAPQVPERNHPQHGSTIGSSLDNGAAGTLTTLAPTGSSPIAQVMAPTSEQLDTIKKYKVCEMEMAAVVAGKHITVCMPYEWRCKNEAFALAKVLNIAWPNWRRG